jgi:hypothetical protein
MSIAILIIHIVNETLKRDTPLARTVRAYLPARNEFLAQARQAVTNASKLFKSGMIGVRIRVQSQLQRYGKPGLKETEYPNEHDG